MLSIQKQTAGYGLTRYPGVAWNCYFFDGEVPATSEAVTIDYSDMGALQAAALGMCQVDLTAQPSGGIDLVYRSVADAANALYIPLAGKYQARWKNISVKEGPNFTKDRWASSLQARASGAQSPVYLYYVADNYIDIELYAEEELHSLYLGYTSNYATVNIKVWDEQAGDWTLVESNKLTNNSTVDLDGYTSKKIRIEHAGSTWRMTYIKVYTKSMAHNVDRTPTWALLVPREQSAYANFKPFMLLEVGGPETGREALTNKSTFSPTEDIVFLGSVIEYGALKNAV